MLIESSLLGILIVCITYKYHRFKFESFRYSSLLFIAIFLQIIGERLINTSFNHIVMKFTGVIQITLYILLITFALLNIKRYNSFIVLLIGTVLNAIVIMLNGGFMPVDPQLGLEYGFQATLKALEQGLVFGHALMTSQTILPILGDCIMVPPPYLFPKTISVGDIAIDIGVLLLVTEIILRSKRKMEDCNVV